jgi:hypothetical protein
MSQKNVERVIGRLVTDEAFRLWFAIDPESALQTLTGYGIELTSYERQALQCVNLRAVDEFADTIDPCLQKSNLGRGNK